VILGGADVVVWFCGCSKRTDFAGFVVVRDEGGGVGVGELLVAIVPGCWGAGWYDTGGVVAVVLLKRVCRRPVS